MLRSLLGSPEFLRIITFLAVLIVVVAHVFWLLERRRNPDFPKPYLQGVWAGIWYTVVTLVTVGYGDHTAKSVPGRLVAMGWMFLSLFLVASFTANIRWRIKPPNVGAVNFVSQGDLFNVVDKLNGVKASQ